MSDSVRPHRRQPTRLPHPWYSPGKNTGAGCHFLLQCMKVKSESEVTQSCPTVSDPMDCSLPGSSIHGILQAKILEWVDFPSPGDLPNPGSNLDLLRCRWILLPVAPPGKPHLSLNLAFSQFCSGEGTGDPLQYSCLENPMDGGAW